jgi:hypothetical protein
VPELQVLLHILRPSTFLHLILQGIHSALSGYAGGHVENPTYEEGEHSPLLPHITLGLAFLRKAAV